MSNERRRYDAGFKARVALEAIKGVKTIAELSSEYKIHSTQIQGWKKLLQVGTVSIFQDGRKHKEEIRNEELVDRLYNKIGQLEVELDFYSAHQNGATCAQINGAREEHEVVLISFQVEVCDYRNALRVSFQSWRGGRSRWTLG